MRAVLLLAALATVEGLQIATPAWPVRSARCSPIACSIVVSDPPAENDRTIVDGPDGAIIVTKVKGEYYAVDATCPHLGLPMKRGKIADGPDGVTLTCNFHNSCWSMADGSCKKWVTGALGFENALAAGVMGSVGGAKSDIKAYDVTVAEDGSLIID
ncbi:hypothetical protein AB1Y20_016898 [Prymnesium parvum]|uniref:Rieske domain-containing protein n=1 Tax=Prymnesium parvum TaxID=97485 RepID=A0AB34IC84_PRYPA